MSTTMRCLPNVSVKSFQALVSTLRDVEAGSIVYLFVQCITKITCHEELVVGFHCRINSSSGSNGAGLSLLSLVYSVYSLFGAPNPKLQLSSITTTPRLRDSVAIRRENTRIPTSTRNPRISSEAAARFRLIGFAHLFLYFDDPDQDEERNGTNGTSDSLHLAIHNNDGRRFVDDPHSIPRNSKEIPGSHSPNSCLPFY